MASERAERYLRECWPRPHEVKEGTWTFATRWLLNQIDAYLDWLDTL